MNTPSSFKEILESPNTDTLTRYSTDNSKHKRFKIILSIFLLLLVSLVIKHIYTSQQTNNEAQKVDQSQIEKIQASSGEDDKPVDTSNWKTYIDPVYNFSFKYPDRYFINDEEGSLSHIDVVKSKTVILSIDEEGWRDFPLITVSIDNSGGYLDRYFTNKNNYQTREKENKLRERIENADTEFLKGDAEWNLYTRIIDGFIAYQSENIFFDHFSAISSVAFLKDNKTYSIALVTEFQEDLDHFENIVSTFKFINDSNPIKAGVLIVSEDSNGNVIIYNQANSSEGEIAEMRIWSDTINNTLWQPYTEATIYPPNNTIYIQFKDIKGNLSKTYTDTFTPHIFTTSDTHYVCGGIMSIICPHNLTCTIDQEEQSRSGSYASGTCE